MSHLWDIFHTLKISLEVSLNKVFLFWIVLLVFDLEIFFDSIFSSRSCIVLGCDVHGSLWFPFLCYIRCTSKFILFIWISIIVLFVENVILSSFFCDFVKNNFICLFETGSFSIFQAGFKLPCTSNLPAIFLYQVPTCWDCGQVPSYT